MDGVPWELPRQISSPPVRVFGSSPPSKQLQHNRKSGHIPLDTTNEGSTSSEVSDDQKDKKVATSQIRVLAKMVSALKQ
jgi:hypothetical protein